MSKLTDYIFAVSNFMVVLLLLPGVINNHTLNGLFNTLIISSCFVMGINCVVRINKN
jgi:hypothetical protein